MSEHKKLNESERDDLVAFLDGELKGEQARTLEAKLSLNPEARAEAEGLRRTWELLDYLPRPQPSPAFTHRTLQRLTPVRADERRRGRRWSTVALALGWTIALLFFGWIGYAGYGWTHRRAIRHHRAEEQPAQLHEDREWIERLPKKVRDDLERLSPEERAAQVAHLRDQEREQRLLWKRPPSPARLLEFPPEVQNFVRKNLFPRLTAEEHARYLQAEGRWPDFPHLIKELAKRHPVLPPLPAPHKAIAHFDDLPDKAKAEAGAKINWERRKDAWSALRKVEGKWPEWALTFHHYLNAQQQEKMPPLGASRPQDFPAEVRAFLKTLRRKVKEGEWRQLQRLEGKWPDYPLHLLQLAEKHRLEVPGMSLPGPAELWDGMR